MDTNCKNKKIISGTLVESNVYIIYRRIPSVKIGMIIYHKEENTIYIA